MEKIGVSVSIRGLVASADKERFIRRMTDFLGAGGGTDFLVQGVLEGNGALIGMPSIDEAEDLRDDLIDVGAIAEVIDHDA